MSAAGGQQGTRPGPMAWLWRGYMRVHVWAIAAAMFFMTIEGAMLGALSYIVQPMFDDVFIGGDRGAMLVVAAAVMVMFTARGISGLVQNVLVVRVGERIKIALQVDMLRHVMGLDSAWHQVQSPGALLERVRGDTELVKTVWSTVLAATLRDVVALGSLLAVAISVDPVWTLIAVAGAPILVGPILLLQRLTRSSSEAVREAAQALSVRLDEIFHGIAAIKLNRQEDAQARRFAGLTRGYLSNSTRAAAGQFGTPALMDVVAGLGFVGVLVYGGAQIIEGEKSVGAFMSFFTAMALAFEPLRRLGRIGGAWQVARVSVERLRAVFEAEAKLASPARPVALLPEHSGGDIAFDDVHFGYAGGHAVLRGLSFTARAGQTTALVGASGAGKTTVFHLLTRLADVEAGAITLGGQDLRGFDLARLRDAFAVVSQDAGLFDETIRDNILFGRPDATAEEVEAAARDAHVLDFAAQLPDGLDTKVGPRGSGLSGGQRQRVAIARALLRDAPILLLDEPTSALDSASEAAVQDALERLSAGRTTLVIAHRLSTVRDAAAIVVLDQGRAVDTGTHDALLARGGLYASLHALQFREGVGDGVRKG